MRVPTRTAAALIAALTTGALGLVGSPQAQAIAPADAASEYGTTDIGSAQWWSRVPARSPVKVRRDGQWVTSCPRGWVGGPAGMLLPPKDGKVTVAWRGGGMRSVDRWSFICQKLVAPLQPASPQHLAGWTFAKGRSLLRHVDVASPPLDTCVAAVAPTGWTATVNSVDLIAGDRPIHTGDPNSGTTTYTFGGPNATVGFYSITWTLTGGVGSYRYSTLEGTTYGGNEWVTRDVTLAPTETELTIRSFLSPVPMMPFAASQLDAMAGVISPQCGQASVPWGFVPAKDWADSGSIDHTLMPFVIERQGTFTVESDGSGS